MSSGKVPLVTGPQTPFERPGPVWEKVNPAFVPPASTAFGVPQPVLEIDHGLDDDDLFPENFRGWLVILGCFIMSSITLGFGLSWGVFQEYYKHHLLVGTPESVLGLLGSLQGAVGTVSSLFIGKLGDRYGYQRFTICALVCSVAHLLGAAFSTKLWQFFLTQGILQGLANGLALPFIFAYPAQWFKRRRGLASGIVAGGSSFGGGASTLILRAMLTRIAFRDALIIYAGIHFVLLSIAVCLIKEGPGVVAMRTAHTESRWMDKHLLRDPVFWCATMSLCLSVFGFLSPYFLMPTYAISIIPSLTPQYSVLPMSIMNFMSALGRSLIGFMADLIGPANAFMLAVMISALSQLLIWNFAYNYAAIMVFSIVFGATGGCFLSLMTPLAAQLFGTNNLAGLVGTFSFLITPGDLAGAPIAGAVLSAASGNWHAPISYSGGVQIVAVLVMAYARFKRQPRLLAKF